MKINFGGKDRGFQWGMGCIERYCELMGGDLETLFELDQTGLRKARATVNLLFAALQNYAELNDEVIDFNYAKIQDWMDTADRSTTAAIMEDFTKSRLLGRTVQEYFDDMAQEDGSANDAVKKK